MSETNPEWQTKKSLDLFWPSVILQPPLPPIEAEVHRKVSKATRATMGTFPGKLKTGLRKKHPEWQTKQQNLDLFWSSIILQPPLPPIEAEVHRKVSKATRATVG